MNECFLCEREYLPEDSTAASSGTFCTVECEQSFAVNADVRIKQAKEAGLIDDEGNAIIGNSYQQALERTLRAAQALTSTPNSTDIVKAHRIVFPPRK